MKQHVLFSYIYDFLSTLFERDATKLIDEIERIILFGSVARGDFDEQSDIDLFIDIKKKELVEEIQKTVDVALLQFETLAEKTWNLRNIDLSIRPVVGKLDQPEWKELQHEISGTGVVLYSQYEKKPAKLDEVALISYSLRKARQNTKMQVLRTLYGYTTRKGKKMYTTKGLVHSIDAKKTTTNQLSVKIRDVKKVTDVLNQLRIPFTIKRVWIERET